MRRPIIPTSVAMSECAGTLEDVMAWHVMLMSASLCGYHSLGHGA